MLSKELENTLNETFRTARARRHEFITVEHLLLALLDDSAAVQCLRPAKLIWMTFAES